MQYKSYLIEEGLDKIQKNNFLFYGENIGLKDEFEESKREVNNLEFYECKDFLEMAEIIKASKFFVGNMSLQYIISEALKIPRLLEASPDYPVAFPVGPNAFDAYHQIHFEKFFRNLNNS